MNPFGRSVPMMALCIAVFGSVAMPAAAQERTFFSLVGDASPPGSAPEILDRDRALAEAVARRRVRGTSLLTTPRLITTLSGAQLVPPAPTRAGGFVIVAFDDGFSQAEVSVSLNGTTGVTGLRLHCGRPGDVAPPLVEIVASASCRLTDAGTENTTCVFDNHDLTGALCASSDRPIRNLAALAFAPEGEIFATVVTTTAPRGASRGHFSRLSIPDEPLAFCCSVGTCSCDGISDCVDMLLAGACVGPDLGQSFCKQDADFDCAGDSSCICD